MQYAHAYCVRIVLRTTRLRGNRVAPKKTSDDGTVRIGERVKQARQARGWTQYQLAVAIGRRDGDISRYENGRIEPKTLFVRDCAVAMGVSWEYLTGLTDDLKASLDPKWRDPSGTPS